jgi:PKD repeat protein
MKLLLNGILLMGALLFFTACGDDDDDTTVDAPTAAFSATVSGLDVTFSNTSSGATSYSWNFGDGSGTSTDENPSYTYGADGTYTVTLTATNEGGSDVAEQSVTVTAGAMGDAMTGRWRIASEEGAIAVGSTAGNNDYWFLPAADVTVRACYLDDVYVFGADGSFSNELGDQTWLETWQEGVSEEGCGTPIAPHDGTATGTYELTETTLTVNGEGLFIGLSKAVNGAELPNVAVPASITYTIAEMSDTAVTLHLQVGDVVWWTFNLVKE